MGEAETEACLSLPKGSRIAGGSASVSSGLQAADSQGFVASVVEHQSVEAEFPSQPHHRFSIALGERLGVWCDIPGRKTAANIGDRHINLVPADQTTWVDDPTPGRFLHLRLDPALFETWLTDEGSVSPLAPAFNIYDPEIAKLANNILGLSGAGRSIGKLRINRLATEFCSAVARLNGRPPVFSSANRLTAWELRRIDEFMDAYGDDVIDLDALAELTRRPRLVFLQAFLAATGLPPEVYLTATRIRKARRLIETTRLSEQDIAVKCGFLTEHDFNLAFEGALGISTSAYRILRD